jgi:hypothetical protein
VLNASAYSAGFNDYSNVEWIWGSAQVLTKLITIWGWQCRNRPFYQAYINVDFVDLFSATDVRAVFQKKSGSITDLADYRYWITNKFTFTFDADHAIIRT